MLTNDERRTVELTIEWLNNLEHRMGVHNLIDSMPNNFGGRAALQALVDQDPEMTETRLLGRLLVEMYWVVTTDVERWGHTDACECLRCRWLALVNEAPGFDGFLEEYEDEEYEPPAGDGKAPVEEAPDLPVTYQDLEGLTCHELHDYITAHPHQAQAQREQIMGLLMAECAEIGRLWDGLYGTDVNDGPDRAHGTRNRQSMTYSLRLAAGYSYP